MPSFVDSEDFKSIRARIQKEMEQRVKQVCVEQNPMTPEGQAKILRTQGELTGMRLVFAMFATMTSRDEDGDGNR